MTCFLIYAARNHANEKATREEWKTETILIPADYRSRSLGCSANNSAEIVSSHFHDRGL